jgi:hypothetical protein
MPKDLPYLGINKNLVNTVGLLELKLCKQKGKPFDPSENFCLAFSVFQKTVNGYDKYNPLLEKVFESGGRVSKSSANPEFIRKFGLVYEHFH